MNITYHLRDGSAHRVVDALPQQIVANVEHVTNRAGSTRLTSDRDGLVLDGAAEFNNTDVARIEIDLEA